MNIIKTVIQKFRQPAPPALYLKFYRHPEGKWIMKVHDYLRLRNIVRDENPKRILELGTGIGCATAALAENFEGKLFTIEQNTHCISIAKELIPENLQKRIEFLQQNVRVAQYPQIPYQYFIQFESLPDEPWDMIVIDGPGPIEVEEQKMMIHLPNGDIFSLLPRLKENCLIYVEGRKEMSNLLKRYGGMYLQQVSVGQKQEYHLFRRNEVPFQGFIDTAYQKMKKEGFFE